MNTTPTNKPFKPWSQQPLDNSNIKHVFSDLKNQLLILKKQLQDQKEKLK